MSQINSKPSHQYSIDQKDLLAVFIEQNDCFGEDMNIIMSLEKKFYGLKVFQKQSLNQYSHLICDGISALKLLHLDQKSKITTFPKGFLKVKFYFNFPFLKSLIGKMFSSTKTFHNDLYSFFDKTGTGQNLVTISFNKQETKSILNKAKADRVSLNAFIVNAIYQKTNHLFKQSNWLIPVFAPRTFLPPADAPIANNASGLELIMQESESKENIYSQYQEELKSAGPFFWRRSLDIIRLVLKFIPSKKFLMGAVEGTKRTGIVSNLGNFEGDLEGTIVFTAPISMGNPSAFGVVTYNGELSLSCHTRDGAGPSLELIHNVCEKLRQDLIS